jgi:hypothetical protein
MKDCYWHKGQCKARKLHAIRTTRHEVYPMRKELDRKNGPSGSAANFDPSIDYFNSPDSAAFGGQRQKYGYANKESQFPPVFSTNTPVGGNQNFGPAV